jgi:hypothetical protein
MRSKGKNAFTVGLVLHKMPDVWPGRGTGFAICREGMPGGEAPTRPWVGRQNEGQGGCLLGIWKNAFPGIFLVGKTKTWFSLSFIFNHLA